jgi:hypothetical protein
MDKRGKMRCGGGGEVKMNNAEENNKKKGNGKKGSESK